MKRPYKIFASVLAGVLILAFTVTTVVLDSQKRTLRNQVSGIYNKAFEELVTDVTSLESKLYKLDAARGLNQQSMLLLDVWRQTGDTESSISALPVSYSKTSSLTQFVNRTGDYCRFLSRKISMGESLTDEDFEQIRALADSCGKIYDELDKLWQQGYPGETGFEEDVFLAEEPEEGNLDFTNQEFPRLMYDGPFSESTEDKQPEGLGDATVTREQAAKAAATFLGIDPSALKDAGEQNGTIACYRFSGQQDDFSINVSKQGGKVLWYMSSHGGGISAVPTEEKYEQLAKAAKKYVKNKGYGESATSYAQFYNGMAVINLAPVESEVVLYPDLIKVWVDIPTAEVMGIDTYNYLMSHKTRTLPSPKLRKDEAKEKLPAGMDVQNVRLALIPLETNEEKICWEFTGSMNGRDYIIYINAETGAEEDILMIQHTNDGTLVM